MLNMDGIIWLITENISRKNSVGKLSVYVDKYRIYTCETFKRESVML